MVYTIIAVVLLCLAFFLKKIFLEVGINFELFTALVF